MFLQDSSVASWIKPYRGTIAGMNLLLIAQIIVSVLLVICILPQGQGGGLGSTFGSTSYHTRQGLEKGLFKLTIILAVIFTGLSVASLF